MGGIFGLAHVDALGVTHIISVINDINIGEELTESGKIYKVSAFSTPTLTPAPPALQHTWMHARTHARNIQAHQPRLPNPMPVGSMSHPTLD